MAVDFEGDFNTGAYASWGPTVANRVPVHATGPYAVPNARAATRAIYTNNPPAGAFRGFGVPQAAIAHEALMDELAEPGWAWTCWNSAISMPYGPGDETATGQRLHGQRRAGQMPGGLAGPNGARRGPRPKRPIGSRAA